MTRGAHRSIWINWILVVFILWFGSYAYEYVFAQTGLKPLYSYFALLGFGLFYLLYRAASGLSLADALNSIVGALLVWLGLYLAYGAFEFLRSTQDAVAIQTLITLCEAVLLIGMLVLLMADERRLRLVMVALALLALVGTVINIWDFCLPTFSLVPGRAAGLYANPNGAGNITALLMVGGISAVPRRLRFPYVLACGIGVLVTFSRGAWVVWAIAVIWLGWEGYFGRTRNRFLMIALAIAVGAGFIASIFAGTIGSYVAKSPVAQYLTPNTAARLGIGASVMSGYSAEQRESLVADSVGEGAAKPWLGHGLGYTTEWRFPKGPHDMYLLFFVEGGMIGLVLYLALMFFLWHYGIGNSRVVALQIIISSFLTHNHLNDPAIFIMIAFVFAHGAVMSAQHETSPVRLGLLPT